MPQFNNFNYALQLQSNNLPNGIIQPTSNLINNSQAVFSFTNSNDSNNQIICNSNHSQSAILTPGRKSASPTFFHSNDTLYSRQLNDCQVNFFHCAYYNKHLNLNSLQNQFPFPNINGSHLTVPSHLDSTLKIPTTPTRSKSLSPSLRFVNQPARLRHKQQNKNSTTSEQNQFLTKNNDKSRPENKKNSNSNENCCFQPINNLKIKNDKSSKKLDYLNNLGDKLESNFEVYKSSLKLNESNEKIQIKKPIPILPINHKSEAFFDKTSPSKQQDIFVNKLNNNKINNSEEVSAEIDCLENQKFQNHDFFEEKNQKFKLPLNVRMINLNNYPPNISAVAKRQFSILMQRVKSENINNSDKCIQILKQNFQCIFNQEIKQLVGQFKKSFIDPAVKNFNQNKNDSPISENEMFVFILGLVDDAKKNLFDFENKNSAFGYNLTAPIKRKLRRDSIDDLTELELSNETKRKKSKFRNLNSEEKNDKKELIFNSETKFVLGKNANDIFLELQQQFYEVNSEDSYSSVSQADWAYPKSIYSRFPNLFRYEADQQDRHWLNDNQILKRRNIKCIILLLDEINELFKDNFKLNSSNGLKDTENENRQESNDSPDEKDLILGKLKSFSLPKFILNKLKKNYSIRKSKFV